MKMFSLNSNQKQLDKSPFLWYNVCIIRKEIFMYNKCDICFNRRIIVSENGYHAICNLSSKKAVDCLLCKKNYFMLDEKRTKKEKIYLIDSTK